MFKTPLYLYSYSSWRSFLKLKSFESAHCRQMFLYKWPSCCANLQGGCKFTFTLESWSSQGGDVALIVHDITWAKEPTHAPSSLSPCSRGKGFISSLEKENVASTKYRTETHWLSDHSVQALDSGIGGIVLHFILIFRINLNWSKTSSIFDYSLFSCVSIHGKYLPPTPSSSLQCLPAPT